MYQVDCLLILAMRFGRYLGTNNTTINKIRALGVHICAKIDLSEEQVQGFPIVVMANKTFLQEVKYKKVFIVGSVTGKNIPMLCVVHE